MMRSQRHFSKRCAAAAVDRLARVGLLVLAVSILGGRLRAAEVPPTQAEVEVGEFAVVESENTISRTDALIASVTIFVLSIFVGFELITKVPPTLHTPLMSGSNAISGITVVGALLVAGFAGGKAAPFLGMLAVIMATINVVGGFLVTHRMLSMFRRK